MTDDMDALHPDSKALHADRPLNRTRAVTAPIWQTSTFWAETDEEFLDMATRPRHDMFYTRYGNPTHSQVAAVVAALEGGEEALVTASGGASPHSCHSMQPSIIMRVTLLNSSQLHVEMGLMFISKTSEVLFGKPSCRCSTSLRACRCAA